MRPTHCIIDPSAIEANVRTLAARIAPTPVCAVVKADGYGHGAVTAARAAIAGGATWLAVAIVEEGADLRAAGIEVPILILSEPPVSAMTAVVERSLVPTVYSSSGIDALDAAAAQAGEVVEVHLGVDSGMGRVGSQLDGIREVADHIGRSHHLTLSAVWTHCPVADEPDNPFTERQLERFGTAVSEQLPGLALHVANSAVAITGHAASAGAPMMARYGIAIYGIDPDPALAGMVDLQPALTLRSEVSYVKTVRAGEGVGYGHRWIARCDTTIATVPIGYADGVRRDLGLSGGSVLIDGRRCPIVGVVTMDQLMVDVGAGPDAAAVAVGDEVVLIGKQGGAEISASDVAETLGTISYEIVCAISQRVPRVRVAER